MQRTPTMKSVLAALVLATLLVRGSVLYFGFNNLDNDRDAYRALATQVAAGKGYSIPETGRPTAFRPPLYPLLLAEIFRVGWGNIALALLHLVLGAGTVLLAAYAGRQLQLGPFGLLAALLVMVDPLLLHYSTLSMTETPAAFLTMLLVVLILARKDDGRDAPAPSATDQPAPPATESHNKTAQQLRSALVGIVFGLAALCRPTIWAFAPLAALVWLMRLRQTSSLRPSNVFKSLPWPMLVALLFVVLPWAVRNAMVLGKPIVTTTHGGYTLLLGNNPVYYAEVVSKPLGTTWSDAPTGRDQKAWYDGVRSDMDRDLGAEASEIERDRYQYRLAYAHIAAEPGLFARACLLRFIRFWDIAPQGSEARQLPPSALWGIRVFYGLVHVGFAVGLMRLARVERRLWSWLLLLVGSYCAVHLFYWTDMRMRAPVAPVIALLAARGVRFGQGRFGDEIRP